MVLGKVMQYGGRGEAVLALCYVFCCALLTQDFNLVVIGSGIVLAWAIYLVPHAAVLANFFLLACVVALFSFGSELAFLVGITGFLLLEVLASYASWPWVVSAAGILFGWFCLGEPNQSWQISPAVVPLVGAVAALVAVLIGVLRRSARRLRARRDAELKVIRLETRMEVAKQLHIGTADSLTRLIALAHEVSPELESQARQASLRLRELLDSLRTQPRDTTPVDIRAEIREGTKVMQGAHIKVQQRLAKNAVLVDPLVALVARELLTNALKYCATQVRIELESQSGEGLLLIANDVKTPAEDVRDSAISNGLGLEQIYAMATVSGARIHSHEELGVRSVVLEFPIYLQELEN